VALDIRDHRFNEMTYRGDGCDGRGFMPCDEVLKFFDLDGSCD
jgi:hypothetical protein